MIIYSATKKEFLAAVEQDSIADEIAKNLHEHMHKRVAPNEFRAWENSLEYMYKVLTDDEIPDNAGVAIEYNIPQTAKRVDFLISGYDDSMDPQVILLELKQWDKVEIVESQDAVVKTQIGGALRSVAHPSYQAWSYATMIYDYNLNVQMGNMTLHPCVYMHNYRKTASEKLEQELYQKYVKKAPVFGKGQVPHLRAFIKTYIKSGDDLQLLYDMDSGKIKPSKSLQDVIKRMLDGNQEFIMIDEQKVVYEEILSTVSLCVKDQKKRTVIIKGGPGTGKTVVAVNLLARLTGEGLGVQYTSKNSAPRHVYEEKLSGMPKSRISNLLKGSGVYVKAQENMIDVILCDEAHRLNAKSGMYRNTGENQVKEIIYAGLCSVFFIDEHQRVSLEDIGSVAEIRKWAERAGSEVTEMELVSQFRCNGADGYLAWLDDVLEIRETANFDLQKDRYDIRILDSPEELRKLILERNQVNNRSRMLAGYCWPWPKEGKNRSDYHDIKIGNFEMSWNLGNTDTFAIDENSVNEIGCIHTAQGLEFDYVGVIIGDDMRYEDGHVITDFTKRAKYDRTLRGIKKLYRANSEFALKEADEIIKNTYYTLMSRGMKGCYVYCTDQKLAEYLKERLR